jgi:hypothetical protein
VNVKVSLVASIPTLAGIAGPNSAPPADNTVAEGQPSTAQYSLTATANGPDTYNLTSTNAPVNITGAITVSFKQGVNTVTAITLGATAAQVQANVGATTITVPADGIADNNLNGIANGDFVVIGTNIYKVNVTDNATGTSTITLIAGTLPDGTAAPTTLAAIVPVGTLIAEMQAFDMTIANVGSKTNTATAATIDVTTKATSATNNALVATDVHRTNVVNVTFEKFVRNVTTAASNPGVGGVLINGQTYYPTQGTLVSAVSGDTLEYAIRATAPAAVALAGVSITDAVPTFTSYVANSTRLNGITVAGDGATSPLAAGLIVDDNPARAANAAASGNIAAGKSAVVIFQVTVQ